MFGISQRTIKDFDWWLLALAMAVAVFGVIEISSAETARPFLAGSWRNQLWGIAVGLVVMVLTMVYDYRVIIGMSHYFYAVGLVLLILVLTPLGDVVNGNKSWLNLGFMRLQPSEFAKLFTLLMLTRYLSDVRERPPKLRTLLMASAIWIVPTVLVYLENDTGSTLSFTSILAALLFLAGVRWTWIAGAVGVLVLALGLGIPKICSSPSTSYKIQRIKAVYCKEQAEKRYSYQNEQAEIAVGSGGLLGRGIGQGTQGALGFVPEVHTDFIFAVAGEETGFLGSFGLLVAYLLIITRLLLIARQARDRTGMLFVAGFAALLLYHVTVSVGMVVRLMPIMGIPLPLMSFGRSSVLSTFFGLGLAMNVRLRRFVN
jgi:rod shape determining protein RodA